MDLNTLFKGLIVSCQAAERSPLRNPNIMAAMAVCAEENGAVAIRANGPEDIAAIKRAVTIPVIGIFKKTYSNSPIIITPTIDEVRVVVEAGADIVALDATTRQRPNNQSLEDLISMIKTSYHLPVMADVSTFQEGLLAEPLGVDLLATTLSGYTEYSPITTEPDFEIIQQLIGQAHLPVVAEGRFSTPDQARRAMELGAIAVVIGTAITNPGWLTRRFADALVGKKISV